ncbi:MAG TPA: lycopene cyclase family protein [Saprospiraceae bacterium]|nr:lycopene cyclase family protein [Saprospiraceae bacterium]HMP13967.1 lycopene cyclase family protein [Saprospiraceae bacterium]
MYDYIIAGGGCAGLNLALHLNRMQAGACRILLVDRDSKTKNDRTWCFWSNAIDAFAPIVTKRWSALIFADEAGAQQHALHEYQYQLIRGIDFYDFVKAELSNNSNIEWLQGEITRIEETPHAAFVVVDGQRYEASFVFNSCFNWRNYQSNDTTYHLLIQHFMGWVIISDEPVFQPSCATLMDFRTPQHDTARFFYVLPLDERRALVEYTVFSDQVLPRDAYRQSLQHYITERIGLKEYAIEAEEYGAIPMTDLPFPASSGQRIVHIGTPGGAVKPTTGYAFLNIQQQTAQLAAALTSTGSPHVRSRRAYRFRFYDRLLLNILREEGSAAAGIFSRLFRRNRMEMIFRFLDERTTIWQEIRIFSTLPVWTFLAALWRVYVSPSRLRLKRASATPVPHLLTSDKTGI